MTDHALAEILRDAEDRTYVLCSCGWESATWRQQLNALGEFDGHAAEMEMDALSWRGQ